MFEKGHLRNLSRKHFWVTSVDREKSGDLYFMAIALKGVKYKKSTKKKLWSVSLRNAYVMNSLLM